MTVDSSAPGSANDALHYPWPSAPPHGSSREIAPGVRWLEMPINLDLKIINIYLLEDDDGWTVVDTGLPSADIRQYWQQAIAQDLQGKPIKAVICTHLHPDHTGNALWLCDRFDAELLMSETEYLMTCATGYRIRQPVESRELAFYRLAGLSDEAAQQISAAVRAVNVVELPSAYRRLKAGDSLTIGGRQWQVMIGRGHSPEHVCLYCAQSGLLLAGDHILPKISPNISVWPLEPEDNPLGDYFDTLRPFSKLPEDTLVLPGHNLPFRGLRLRIEELLDHHQHHFDTLLDACQADKTVPELMPLLFDRKLEGFNFLMALGECIAHLNFLCQHRLLNRTMVKGVWHYRCD